MCMWWEWEGWSNYLGKYCWNENVCMGKVVTRLTGTESSPAVEFYQSNYFKIMICWDLWWPTSRESSAL